MERIIADITKFIFAEDKPEKSDIIFIPGGSYLELPEKAAELYQQGLAPLIMPSGKYSVTLGKFVGVKSKSELYGEDFETEWEFMAHVLKANSVPESNIIKEDQSTFTKENAVFSRQVADKLGLEIKRAILCCKAFHARRALVYYQAAFPETEFFVVPAVISGITKGNWFLTELGVKRVLGELSRIGSQLPAEILLLLK